MPGLPVVLGVLTGLAWAGLAPVPPPSGTAGLDPYAATSEVFIAADGWFAVLGLPAGLIHGVVAVRRRQPAWIVVGTSLLGSLVAWGVGVAVGPAGVRALGVLLIWPITALLVRAVAAPVPPRLIE